MRFPLLSLLVLAWPLSEIAGFVVVGRAIGLWATLGLVIGTAIIGSLLIRGQGISLIRKLSSEGREGRMPARGVIDEAMKVIAGFLLFLPGFITDIIGLALLVPFIRNFIWSSIGRRVVIVNPQGPNARQRHDDAPSGSGVGGPVVDLDQDDFSRDPKPSSPWSQNRRLDQ
jgi:UPF0716 protein FxsA